MDALAVQARHRDLNGDEEILILLDFANQFEMHAEAMKTYEYT